MQTTRRNAVLVIADGDMLRRIPLGLVSADARFIDLITAEPTDPPPPPTPESVQFEVPNGSLRPIRFPRLFVFDVGIALLSWQIGGPWGLIIVGLVYATVGSLVGAAWQNAQSRRS